MTGFSHYLVVKKEIFINEYVFPLIIGDTMKRFEHNVAHSFDLVKKDIVQLQEAFLSVDKTQELMLQTIERQHKELESNKAAIQSLSKRISGLSASVHTQKAETIRTKTDLKTSQSKLQSAQKESKNLAKELQSKTPKYVGNSKTKKLFDASDKAVAKITKNDQVFFYTKAQAKKAGFM